MSVKTKIAVERIKWLSFRLFLVILGVVIGASGIFVLIEGKKLLMSENTIVIENVRPITVAEKVKEETTEEIIERVAKEKNFSEVETLVKIAFCESSFNRLAENKQSSAKGVFQILDMHGLSALERFDVEKSTKWAVDTIEKQGFKPWNASKHCWSK